MKKRVRYISFGFILLWLIGVVYRIWSASASSGFITVQKYTVLDAITDVSLIIGIVGLFVNIFI